MWSMGHTSTLPMWRLVYKNLIILQCDETKQVIFMCQVAHLLILKSCIHYGEKTSQRKRCTCKHQNFTYTFLNKYIMPNCSHKKSQFGSSTKWGGSDLPTNNCPNYEEAYHLQVCGQVHILIHINQLWVSHKFRFFWIAMGLFDWSIMKEF